MPPALMVHGRQYSPVERIRPRYGLDSQRSPARGLVSSYGHLGFWSLWTARAPARPLPPPDSDEGACQGDKAGVLGAVRRLKKP